MLPATRDKRNCQQKRAYDNEPLARAIGQNQCMHMDKLHSYKHKLYVYQCPNCNRFHLTSKKQRTAAITAADPYFIAS